MGEPSDRELEQLLALDAAAGPAQPIDPARAASIVASALHGAGFPPPGAGGAGGGGGGSAGSGSVQGAGAQRAGRSARRAANRTAFAPKLTVLAGGAGAIAVAVAVIAWLALRAPDAAPPASPASLATASGATPSAAPETLPAAPPAPPGTASIPPALSGAAPAPPALSGTAPAPPALSGAASTATGEPGPPAPPARQPAGTAAASNELAASDTAPRGHAPPRSPSPAKLRATVPPAHRRRSPSRPATVATAGDPEDLLAEANAARLARDWRGADALYARVSPAGGAALAVQTALVASAQLHLEHLGDPAGATRRFHRALIAGARDALAEDARWGLAEAARTTGDPVGERRALDDFLDHHAGSVRAAQARARRAELEAAP